MNLSYTVRCGQSISYSGPASSLPAYVERSNGKVILCRAFHSTRALKSYFYGMNFYGCGGSGYYYIQG